VKIATNTVKTYTRYQYDQYWLSVIASHNCYVLVLKRFYIKHLLRNPAFGIFPFPLKIYIFELTGVLRYCFYI